MPFFKKLKVKPTNRVFSTAAVAAAKEVAAAAAAASVARAAGRSLEDSGFSLSFIFFFYSLFFFVVAAAVVPATAAVAAAAAAGSTSLVVGPLSSLRIALIGRLKRTAKVVLVLCFVGVLLINCAAVGLDRGHHCAGRHCAHGFAGFHGDLRHHNAGRS